MGTSNIFTNTLTINPCTIPMVMPGKKRRNLDERRLKTLGNPFTVGNLLLKAQPLPEKPVLLGQCADGLPLFLTLSDHEPGTVLVGGNYGCGKTHQLQVMAESAMRSSTPQKIQLVVLTSRTDEWQGLYQSDRWSKYLQKMHAWYDPRSEEVIQMLTELVEARQRGKKNGTDILLVLDGLNYVENLAIETQVKLHWLLEYGSQYGIRIVASINASGVDAFRFWIDPFQTRLIGKTGSGQNAAILSTRSDSEAGRLDHGMFRAWSGRGWMTYRLPMLGD